MKTVDMRNLPKVSLISLGCPKNLVGSEVILGNLIQNGFYLCEDYEDADIIIINTCSFLKEAEDEAFKVINDAIRLRDEGKVKAVVVAGCLPQRYISNVEEHIKCVDGIIGIANRDKIRDLCSEVLKKKGNNATNQMPYVRNFLSGEVVCEIDNARLRLTPKHFAYIRIADGCDRTCSFCIIPKIRGRFRSKPMDIILDEVNELARDGAKEIILIAQDTTMYGMDIYKSPLLPELLDKISEIDGVKWIRLLYCYPTLVDSELIKIIAQNPKVVKYIDLPIQHTKEKILRLMQREISEQKQKELLNKLREDIPDIFIRTAIVVGFPGETEGDFEELISDLSALKFDRLGAFKFSKENGTPAFNMDYQVSEEKKAQRLDRVMLLQQEIAFNKNKSLIGKNLEVIVDEKAKNGYIGRTYGDAPDVDGVIELKIKNRKTPICVGNIYKAKVIGAKNYDLIGEI